MSAISILATIEKSLSRFEENNPGIDPRFVLMDNESYFELKIEVLGSVDKAISEDIEEILGLRIFYNVLKYNYIDIA